METRDGKAEVSLQPPAPRRGLPPTYRTLIALVVFFVVVVLIMPIIFQPGVEPPTGLALGSPFSMMVQIANKNMTPLADVEYSCKVSKLTRADGAALADAEVVTRGSRPKIPGRQAIIATCETGYVPNSPVKEAEYELTLTYRMYPWPQHRTLKYHIAAEMSENGRVTGWKLN